MHANCTINQQFDCNKGRRSLARWDHWDDRIFPEIANSLFLQSILSLVCVSWNHSVYEHLWTKITIGEQKTSTANFCVVHTSQWPLKCPVHRFLFIGEYEIFMCYKLFGTKDPLWEDRRKMSDSWASMHLKLLLNHRSNLEEVTNYINRLCTKHWQNCTKMFILGHFCGKRHSVNCSFAYCKSHYDSSYVCATLCVLFQSENHSTHLCGKFHTFRIIFRNRSQEKRIVCGRFLRSLISVKLWTQYGANILLHLLLPISNLYTTLCTNYRQKCKCTTRCNHSAASFHLLDDYTCVYLVQFARFADLCLKRHSNMLWILMIVRHIVPTDISTKLKKFSKKSIYSSRMFSACRNSCFLSTVHISLIFAYNREKSARKVVRHLLLVEILSSLCSWSLFQRRFIFSHFSIWFIRLSTVKKFIGIKMVISLRYVSRYYISNSSLATTIFFNDSKKA